MSTLTSIRADVVTALTGAGLRALGYEPERITPPVAIVYPGSPYLAGVDPASFAPGHYVLRLMVRIVVPVGAAETVTGDLDTAIETAHAALTGAWDLTEVSDPFTFVTNGASFAAVDLTLTDTITL